MWKHFSRFHRKEGNGSVARFDPDCRDCQTKERNELKNLDRPRTIIERRAKDRASKAGVAFKFMWVNMNYQALVPVYRAMLTVEGLCTSCGHEFDNERDVQIEHREPPRHQQDWARLHARNLGIACASCNGTKGKKSYTEWLDEQESARLSNQATPGDPVLGEFIPGQMELFGGDAA